MIIPTGKLVAFEPILSILSWFCTESRREINFRCAAIANAGMMFFCNTGKAGCCTSASSSDVEVEDWSATGSKTVDAGICCAGVG